MVPSRTIQSMIPLSQPEAEQSSKDFENAWKLETQASQLMEEIFHKKEIQRAIRVEELIADVIADVNKSGTPPVQTNTRSLISRVSSFFSDMPPKRQVPKAAQAGMDLKKYDLEAPSAEIVAQQKSLTDVEKALDSLYASNFLGSGNASANPFLKKSAISKSEPRIKWALLYLTTGLRRSLEGIPLHAELSGLQGDEDCSGDLVKNQSFLNLGLSLLAKDYPSAVVTNNYIIGQTLCMSARQLALADHHFVNALKDTLESLNDADQEALISMMMNPLLAFFDAGKSQFSRVLEIMSGYQTKVVRAYDEGTPLRKMGVYLLDWRKGQVQQVDFAPASMDEVSMAIDNDIGIFNEQDIALDLKKATIYGADLEMLQQKCVQMPQAQGQPNTGGSGGFKGPQQNQPKESWGGFSKNMGDPAAIGRGVSPLIETLAQGEHDMGGICGGGAGGGGGGGGMGITCSFSGEDPTAITKAQGCYATLPFKMPAPGGNFMGGGEGGMGGGGPGETNEILKQDFMFKGNPSCGGSSPYADENPADTNEDQKEYEKNKKDAESSKQKAQEKLEQNKTAEKLKEAAGSKFKDPGDQKSSPAPKGTIPIKLSGPASAKETANQALQGATVTNGLTKTVDSNGNYVVKDKSGNEIASGKCTLHCEKGSTELGGFTKVEGGNIQIFLNAEKTNMSRTDIAMHEWAHAFLSAGKVGGGAGDQHSMMHKAGIKGHYCAPTDDNCSASCNAGQANIGNNYSCQSAPWGENLQTAKCDSPVADCKNPNDPVADKEKQGDGYASEEKTGGSPPPPSYDKVSNGGKKPPKPAFCTQISVGPDGFLPPACSDGQDGGMNCSSSDGMAIDIFSLAPGIGFTDPVPWETASKVMNQTLTQDLTLQGTNTLDQSSFTGTQQQMKQSQGTNPTNDGKDFQQSGFGGEPGNGENGDGDE